MGGWRTDRCANGLLGSKTLAWDVDGQLNRRLCRASAACFWLVKLVDTARHDGENSDSLGLARCHIDTNRPKGAKMLENS